LAKRNVSEMSSGESRRVLVGRALVHDPQALVLDEPTNSLDMRSAHELREVFRKVAQSGVGIILVTHHLPDIIPEIERIVLMKKGKVFGDGPKSEILSNGSLSKLFDMPVELIERGGYYHLI
jgi:iron complex transport system ATP-binding protein